MGHAGSTRRGRVVVRELKRTAQQSRVAADHYPPELEHCKRCRRETEHYAVYWYTCKHVFAQPIRAIDGSVIRSVLTRTFVMWCFAHRGAPPTNYTDKPIPLGGWTQRDGEKPAYADAH